MMDLLPRVPYIFRENHVACQKTYNEIATVSGSSNKIPHVQNIMKAKVCNEVRRLN